MRDSKLLSHDHEKQPWESAEKVVRTFFEACAQPPGPAIYPTVPRHAPAPCGRLANWSPDADCLPMQRETQQSANPTTTETQTSVRSLQRPVTGL